MSKSNPPRNDEIELSLFGPGIGECIVVHLGHGDWMIVDSCLGQTGETAIAIEYLQELGVDISKQVKLVIATHWHDDHIRGIGQILRFADSARFGCSAALRCEEFLGLALTSEHIQLVEHNSGVSEFSDILEALHRRNKSRQPRGPDHWAADGMILFANGVADVTSLSPAAQTITNAKGQFAKLLPQPGEAIRKFPRVSPNATSVVLLVRTNSLHLLLGADLEETGNELHGWQAIISSPVRPNVKSAAFKVPHHGSDTADLSGIWTDLVVEGPLAVLAPYARGPKPLPTKSDVQRLLAHTTHLYCTAWPPGKAPPRRRNVDRAINQATKYRRTVRQTPGHIRLRAPGDGTVENISVELFAGAVRLRPEDAA